jgi:NAD(P)-dependent dehydrogenase (short-subunit alcohol dehydrogenase family)
MCPVTDAAVVTGAAGPLGAAVVAEFRDRGLAVVAMGRPSERLDALAKDDDGVHAVAVDLASRAAVQAAFAEVDALPVTPVALVAVAGGFAPGALANLDEDGLDVMWRTNVASTLWTAQAMAPRLRRGGAIVTVGSRVAVTGTGPVAYGASKAAVVRLTELLADELRGKGIRVNAVLPSTIDTPANRQWMAPEQVARSVAPAAIAKVIAFLCGPDAAPVSGAVIPVYGDA